MLPEGSEGTGKCRASREQFLAACRATDTPWCDLLIELWNGPAKSIAAPKATYGTRLSFLNPSDAVRKCCSEDGALLAACLTDPVHFSSTASPGFYDARLRSSVIYSCSPLTRKCLHFIRPPPAVSDGEELSIRVVTARCWTLGLDLIRATVRSSPDPIADSASGAHQVFIDASGFRHSTAVMSREAVFEVQQGATILDMNVVQAMNNPTCRNDVSVAIPQEWSLSSGGDFPGEVWTEYADSDVSHAACAFWT